MKLKNKFAALLVASGSLVAASSAQAASYAAGDLMLYFFSPSNSKAVYVNLGQAYTYRGATAGPQEAIDSPNYALKAKGESGALNLESTLSGVYGSEWKIMTSLYAGLVANFSSSTATTNSAIQNGDPHRTVYFSVPNNLVDEAVGREGLAASLTTIAQRIQGMGTGFTGTDSIKTVDYSATNIDEQNPFLSGSTLGLAYGGFAGGIAQVGTSGTLGSFGDINNVEFALDLHRILAITNPTGTINGLDADGNSIPSGTSMYEGTITIANNGSVAFSAVPEPSSVMLLGLGAGALAFRRRRNA
jgi:hypothetical protein